VRYENVRELFDKCGEIEDLHIKTKYAFIKYKKHEDAVYAIKELHDTMYEGQKLTVERSYPGGARRKRTSGPQTEDKCWRCGEFGHW
jgi:RNA recognition motif-containing protein